MRTQTTWIVLLVTLCVISNGWKVEGKSQIPDEDWGYVTINPTAQSNMFWWLYGAQNSKRDSLPFVVWLQGGPGASSLFGDFMEIGPLDKDLKSRNTSWVTDANLLFLDNPIGTGWSYTVDASGYSTTDNQIAQNLIIFLQKFVTIHPLASSNPFWIFSESYGGKMASFLGVAIHEAVSTGKLKLNFKGVSLGDAWIAPVECMKSYGLFLESQGLVDGQERGVLDSFALEAEKALKNSDGLSATKIWSKQQQRISQVTAGVDFYDYLRYNFNIPSLSTLMNGQIRSKLQTKIKIPDSVKWTGEDVNVFTKLNGDFMKPSIAAVEFLLQKGYTVAVISGQLDIIVDTICINNWVENMNWGGSAGFFKAPHTPFLINQTPSGAVKKFQNLQQWNIFGASHMVPMEAPVMAKAVFLQIISGK